MKNVIEILKTDMIQKLGGDQKIAQFILTQPECLAMMQDRLDAIYKNKKMLKDRKTFAEVMLRPNGFTNRMSISFMPFGILNQDLLHLKKYKDHPFVVFNPLNGSMCESIKEKIGPNTEIICIDPFGTFSNDLTKRGYQCYNNIGDIPKMKKRPVLLINPPYTNGKQDATGKYGEHIENALKKLNPVAVLTIAPDTLLVGKNNTKNELKIRYGNPSYVRWLNRSTDWNKTIEIDTSVSIWDENKDSIFTEVVDRSDRNKFEVEFNNLIFPTQSKEEYEYICRIQTTKKCTVKLSHSTGNNGKQVKLSKDDSFEIVDGKEHNSNNTMFRQVVAYMRTKCLADVPPGPSISGSYRELRSDYSPTTDEVISKKFGRYMRSGHTRWLVDLRYTTRSLDAPALSLVPMVNLDNLPDNFTDQDLYHYFDTPQSIIDKITDYGTASPY